MFYRTSRMIQAGIKPVYVFDGKPPQLKRDELDRRGTRRDEADDELKKAQETGDQEAIARFSKRTVKVTKTHVDDSKKLLSLMGVPFVEVSLALPCNEY
jgi:flap endonuclease-1